MTCVGHSGQFLERGELSGGARDGVCVCGRIHCHGWRQQWVKYM